MLSRDDTVSFMSQVVSAKRDPTPFQPNWPRPWCTRSQTGHQGAGLSCSKIFTKGLAESTQRSYRSAQKKFLHFCEESNFRAVPASGEVLGLYVSYLAEQGLKHSTIRVYPSAIRFLHIAEGETATLLVGAPSL